jgi:Tol biopolymer transport system component
VKPLLQAGAEYLRSSRRPVCVVVLACLGIFSSFLAPSSAGWAAGGSFNAGVVWANYTEGIYAANVDGSGVHRLVPRIADMHSDPAWSPSGDALVFSARISDSVDLHILRPATGTLRVLKLRSRWTSPRRAHVFSYVLQSTWAPDEQHLALSEGWNLVNSTIKLVSLQTGRLRPLTRPSHSRADSSPAWSPDGGTIAFVRQPVRRDELGSPVIFLIGRDGSAFHKLTRGNSPSWSPHGRHVVFAWGDGIFRIDADGGARTRLAGRLGGRGSGLQPRWSPDGRKILYVTRGGLWIMNVNGTDRVRILRHRGISGAGWQPG